MPVKINCVMQRGVNDGELLELCAVFLHLKGEMLNHMQKEEGVMFPMCRRLERGDWPDNPVRAAVERPVDVLTHEHEDAGRALEAMRRLTNDFTPPPDACNSYRALFDSLKELEADMHQHVHLENNVLFPEALRADAAWRKAAKAGGATA